MLLQNVIIQSIGTAKPSVGKVLADVLGVSNEQVVRLLYCTPSVLFRQVEAALAAQTAELLGQLGLDVQVTDADSPLPTAPVLYDLAVFLPNPLQLVTVGQQVAAFLGCNEQEALNLLLQDPPVVLGGVSEATAQALSQQIEAEVVMANPKEEKYTVQLCSNDASFARQWATACQGLGLHPQPGNRSVKDVDYATAHKLWHRLGANKGVTIYNQGFLRYEIILESIDKDYTAWRPMLIDTVGIPEDIVDEVANNLPVQLNDSLNRHDLQQLLGQYKAAGLQCSFAELPFGNQQLVVDEISQPTETAAILSQFYGPTTLGNDTQWQAPKPISPVLGRLAAHQLEQIGCTVTTNTL
jgi:hypothetical protein